MEEAKLELSSDTDYELCALFVDYREWLNSPTMGPKSKPTRDKYEGYLKDILSELGNRHGFKPSEGELAFMADAVGADAKPYLRDMGEEQLRGCQEIYKTLVSYCDEVLKEKGEQ